ncbi:MAG TPA: NDP-sugar synthase [Blastocatellia bacterium]|nr:NDP-sugar synthase [Blastocatellia bacterium]
MKAMILAAGFGTRLWPLTAGRTKPAIPFLNRPLIAYTIDYLKQYGVADLIINLHHEPASVRDQIGDGSQYGMTITYSLEEPDILGTAGALDNVRELLQGETFLVINGKIITDIDLTAALATHRRKNALATLVMRPNPAREKFSQIIVDERGNYRGFGGFPRADDTAGAAPLMFTGIHVLEPGVFDYIPRGVFSDSVRDVYPKATQAGQTIAAHVAEGSWYELSTLGRYVEIHREFSAREGRNYTADEGCVIEPGAHIEGSVLWKRVRIGAGARVIECVVGDDVVVPDGAEFRRCAIVRAETAPLGERPEKAVPAEVIDNNLVASFA